jgi:hypothetical protein
MSISIDWPTIWRAGCVMSWFCESGCGVRQLRQAAEQLAVIPPEDERVLIGTGKYIGEGFDDPRLDTLFVTLPVSWRGTIAQYVGRLHRLYDGKREVRVYEDLNVPMLARMFECRCQTPYQAPNANAHAQRFVRSIKAECLDQIIPMGERHCRRAVQEFIEHYHRERNHQGIGNTMIAGAPARTVGPIRRPRLGGLTLIITSGCERWIG